MTTIRIAAVGDILMWRRQIASAKVPGTSSYSFDSMFKEVAPILRGADLTIGNLETTLSGREAVYQKKNPKTGWPMFNCPDELAGALKRAGFQVLTTANNHCMDRGIEGLRRTLRILDERGIAHTGTFRTREESRKLLIRNVRGVRVGILAYTYGTNGIPVPSHAAWAVNRMNQGKITSDIRRMKGNCDVTIVVLHFGQEFQRFPNERQKSLVRTVFQSGADIVLGVHPHVLQPMALVGGKPRQKFVIYSMGNFISDTMMGKIHSDSGVIVKLNVSKDTHGKVSISGVRAVPTWVHKQPTRGGTKFRVLPVYAFLSRKDPKLSAEDRKTLKTVYAMTTRHLALRHVQTDGTVQRAQGQGGAKSQGGTKRQGAGSRRRIPAPPIQKGKVVQKSKAIQKSKVVRKTKAIRKPTLQGRIPAWLKIPPNVRVWLGSLPPDSSK